MPYSAVAVIAAMWVGSLLLPVWRAGGRETMTGSGILLAGCVGMQPQWLGNPLMILVWALALWGVSSEFLMIPLALLLLIVFAGTAMTRKILLDEGGNIGAIERKFAGYYLWMAAVLGTALLAVGLALVSIRNP